MSPWVKYQIACAQILMHVCAGSDNVMSSNNKKIASIIGPRIFSLGQTRIPNIYSKFGLCKPQAGELKMGSHRFYII